jgi:hypothetical protein
MSSSRLKRERHIALSAEFQQHGAAGSSEIVKTQGRSKTTKSVTIAPTPKLSSDDKMQREIESIKRTLYNALDKLDRLKEEPVVGQ